ncbi:hypothetical protein [Vibrio fluvialis]|uniref:hypothetical protein n=1 Tax=Vibrio fluvialis TaxID=676 RepID=UPI0023A93CE1|nr:hypothetical protein [Vibrio fluvialis]MDE5179152.1 hypothetical protein [Vibrio fluvialis]
MHNITPNEKHLIVPVTLAIHSSITDLNEVADGLNELLRSSVDANFVADYQFISQGNESRTASSDAEEGELFSEHVAINTQIYPNSQSCDTKIVWVVGSDSLSSSSFDWYPNEAPARKQYENDKSFVMKVSKTQQHFFAFEVDASLSNDEVTDEVDAFYDEHFRSKAFNMSKLVECYPYTADGWDYLVKEHGRMSEEQSA